MKRLQFLGLFFFIFTIPWQDAIYLPGVTVLSVSRIAGMVLLLAAITSSVQRGIIQVRPPSINLLITALFTAWAISSLLWNVNSPVPGTIKAITFVQLTVMCALIWQLCRTRMEHMALLQAFVLGSYFLVLRIVSSFVLNPFQPNSAASMERYSIGNANPNGVGALMALAIPIAWYLAVYWSKGKGTLRLINFLYIPLAIFAIILTASRGSFLIAITGLLLVPLSFPDLPAKARVLILVGAVASGAAILTFIPASNFARIAETSSELDAGNVSNRSQIWESGWEMYKDYPILGVGTGAFAQSVEPYLGYPQFAHNAFIQSLAELGPIGLVLFTLNVIVTLVPLLGLRRKERNFYIILWLAMIVSMMPSNVDDAQYVWCLFTLMTTRRAFVLRRGPILQRSLRPLR